MYTKRIMVIGILPMYNMHPSRQQLIHVHNENLVYIVKELHNITGLFVQNF